MIQEGIEELGTGCDPLKDNWKDQQKLKFLFSSYPPKYGIKRGPYEHMMEHRSVVTEDINSWIVEFSSDVLITSEIIIKFWWSFEIIEKQNIMSQRKQPEFWMTPNYVHVGRLFIMIRSILFLQINPSPHLISKKFQDLAISLDLFLHVYCRSHCPNHEFCCLWCPWNASDCKPQ